MTEIKEYDIKKLKVLIDAKDIIGIKTFMSENDLILVDNIIESKHKKFFNDESNLYDLKQYVTKIESNSAYGSLLNTSSTFFDFRLGASITMTGRVVWKHLASKTNELLAGIYDHTGDAIVTGDTDSFEKTALIYVNGKQITVEDYYNSLKDKEIVDNNGVFAKRITNGDKTLTTPDGKILEERKMVYVMKHKVKKEMFEIECGGKRIRVTCDHSIMVMRNNELISVKPFEIKEGDKLILVIRENDYCNNKENVIKQCMEFKITDNFKIKSLGIQEEEVYDVEVEDTHTLFANDILVHNSCYATLDTDGFRRLYPNFDYSRDNMSKFSDEIGEKINSTMPEFNKNSFHCTEQASHVHSASREVVASRGLICGKKRYALMVFDKDGKRVDVHGKEGEIKIQGIQVQRSDTNPLVKKLLKNMLNSVLTEGSKEKLVVLMRDFGNNDWDKLNPWDKGTPRTVNKLDFYTKEYNKTGKCSVGQVMASINWNRMLDMMNDKKSPKILDGDKVIVCKLKPNNPYGYKSIALPNTVTKITKWFKQLPFDEQSMVDSVVDKTIETVFGVIGWNLTLRDSMNEDNKELDSILTFC